jgi:hypothetical protein
MVMSIVADAAATYARHGYFTIIDGIVAPGAAFEPVRDRLHDAGVYVAYAILLPDLGVTIQRARARGQTQLADPAVLEHLDAGFAGQFHFTSTWSTTATRPLSRFRLYSPPVSWTYNRNEWPVRPNSQPNPPP